MPYIILPEAPQSLGVGRSAYNGCIDPLTGEYACEVDEVMEGETEITQGRHAEVQAAAQQAHEEAPAPEPMPVEASIEEKYDALLAIVADLAPERVAESAVLSASIDMKAQTG